MILNLNNVLQIIGIDGTGWHQLTMGEDCYGPGAVTSDGNWIACISYPAKYANDNVYTRLQVAALHPTGTSQIHQIQLSTISSYNHLAWSPDGRYLAAELADDCSVAIFSPSPPHTSFTLAVSLNAVQFSDQSGCEIDDLQWSVDGQHLFILGTAGANTAVATAEVGTLLQAFASTSIAQYADLETRSDLLQILMLTNVHLEYLQLFLDPQGTTLFYTAWTPTEQLISFNLHTHQSAALFTLPGDLHIKAVIWMPNGRQFLIAVGDEQCVDCGQYAISDVYLYSPDS